MQNLKLNNISNKSGVYIFKDNADQILYVGKAINLKNRVKSYWQSKNIATRINLLVSKIADIETIIVESELEALILEANLIKKYLPPFNIRLTDDKDYLYIKVTREDFPKIITARKKDLSTAFKFFGPFPSSRTVKQTLKGLRKIFPWCVKPPKKVMSTDRSCFYYHLGLCPGACVGKVSQKDYKKIIKRFLKFMAGGKEELLKELQHEMKIETKKLNFEEAARIKKMILGIHYLTQSNRVKEYLTNPNFLEEETKKSLFELKEVLNLVVFPQRIEGYDISNIQGKQATGSMVVLTNGEIDKSEYRKFKIRYSEVKIEGKPNDVAMHKEMMQRRLNHPEWSLPQLMIIDGGIGQARAVQKVLQDFDKKNQKIVVSDIPIFGLAKKKEWLYPPTGDIIKLSKRSLSLRLLQKIRDEAHRFAISYHRYLRQKNYEINIKKFSN